MYESRQLYEEVPRSIVMILSKSTPGALSSIPSWISEPATKLRTVRYRSSMSTMTPGRTCSQDWLTCSLTTGLYVNRIARIRIDKSIKRATYITPPTLMVVLSTTREGDACYERLIPFSGFAHSIALTREII